MRTRDGSVRWTGLQIALVTDPASNAPRCRAALVDIDARVRMQSGGSRLAAIVASSEDAILSRDLEGRITSWNDAARRLFGYEAEQMIGATCEALVPEGRRNEECELLARLARGETIAHFETDRVARGGIHVPVSMSLSPVRAEDGHVVGSALIARDISERLQSDRAKDAFIATLAHELRNPLAPIRNALEVMRREDLGSDRVKWCRDVLERQVRQMTHLLEDLLDVSRLTGHKIELRRDRILLTAAIEQALESTRPMFEKRNHEVVVDLAEEPIELYGDLTRLTQVFTNLLNNAAKYTDPGGRIEVSMRRDRSVAVIAVSDSGIGIEPANLPRVFDMFAQLRPAVHRSGGGLGIGLALARGLVELHGGTIEARSEGAGRGTRLLVRLPAPPHVDARPSLRPPRRAPGGIPRHRVLVVDDNVDAAQTLTTMLEVHGQDVRTAFDGRHALEIVEQWHPDALILDIGMQDMTGHELCRRIRDRAQSPRPLVIACTGWGQDEDREKSARAGFDAHVVKPVEPEMILGLLRRKAPGHATG